MSALEALGFSIIVFDPAVSDAPPAELRRLLEVGRMNPQFAPGDLVFARGREWVYALPMLNGYAFDLCPVRRPTFSSFTRRWSATSPPARFELPDGKTLATQDAARLLADALRLSLRRGAGPFRSAARLDSSPEPIS